MPGLNAKLDKSSKQTTLWYKSYIMVWYSIQSSLLPTQTQNSMKFINDEKRNSFGPSYAYAFHLLMPKSNA